MTQIISAIQSKGGGGKSTMLQCLAGKMAQDSAKILIIDTDPQKTCIDWAAEKDLKGIDTLAHTDEDTLLDVIEKVQKHYDAILIDTAGFDSRMASYAIQASDLILIPSKGSKSDIMGAAKTWKHAKISTKNNKTPPQIYIVFWGIKQATNVFKHAGQALENAGIPVLGTHVGHLTGFEVMTWNGGLPEGTAASALNKFIAAMQIEKLIGFYNDDEEGAVRGNAA